METADRFHQFPLAPHLLPVRPHVSADDPSIPHLESVASEASWSRYRSFLFAASGPAPKVVRIDARRSENGYVQIPLDRLLKALRQVRLFSPSFQLTKTCPIEDLMVRSLQQTHDSHRSNIATAVIAPAMAMYVAIKSQTSRRIRAALCSRERCADWAASL